MTAIPSDMWAVAAVAAMLAGLFQAGLALTLADRIGERRLRAYEGGRDALRRDLLMANAGIIAVMAALGPFYVLKSWLPGTVEIIWGMVSFAVAGGWLLVPAAKRAAARLVGTFGRISP